MRLRTTWSAAVVSAAVLGCGRTALHESWAQRAGGSPQLVAGGFHVCAILTDSRVKCWGENVYGQLGLGDTDNRGDVPNEMGDNLPDIDLGADEAATAIAAGRSHTCALLDGGGVKCWGGNSFGQLGLGDTNHRGDTANEMGDKLPRVHLGSDKTAVAIIAGEYHSCALLNDGRMKCWGFNLSGQLGLGDENDRGDVPDEMGDHLPAAELGAGATAVAMAAEGGHSCALLSDGRVKCWGSNSGGQLGLGDNKNRGDNPNEMGDNLPAVDLGGDVTVAAITAGLGHSCALLSEGRIKCWGENLYGQLGLGDNKNRGDDPNEMGDNLPAVDLGGDVTAAAITAGLEHSCALLSGGRVKCWGQNFHGQLGLGVADEYRGNAPNQMGDNLPPVDLGTGMTGTAITTGSVQTCVLLEGHRVKCWGYGYAGELGLGDTDDRGDSPDEMGDYLPAVDL